MVDPAVKRDKYQENNSTLLYITFYRVEHLINLCEGIKEQFKAVSELTDKWRVAMRGVNEAIRRMRNIDTLFRFSSILQRIHVLTVAVVVTAIAYRC